MLIDLKKNTCYNVKKYFLSGAYLCVGRHEKRFIEPLFDCESETPAKNKKTKREKLVWRFL